MDFSLKKGQQCVIRIDERETEAVKIAVSNLAGDLERTMGIWATVLQSAGKELHPAGEKTAQYARRISQDAGADIQNAGEDRSREAPAEILIGTLDVSEVISNSVDPALLCDTTGSLRKEAYLHKVSDGKLIIAGSDRRGTIYGIYELCEELGVSPWYFWADVPVRKRQEFSLPEDYIKADYPSVEYRGIFINDEEELEAWVQNYMGEPTIGVKTYEKVFELLLRLKANYIWPAMHVNSFNLTPENGALADRMGIVAGTSHCDMLMRSNNREWKPWIRKKGYTDAVYDYSIEGKNREILREYWKESVEQNRDFEVCYTLGMRGIHDSGFETKNLEGKTEEEIRSAKVSLLETIISDQRKILKGTLGRDTMMTFIPYKEVLDLYDNGLEIPEDMTLVWANDNYGHIRRYPSEQERARRGGNGIYYHNSYWAPPSMSYVFLCSIPLAHTRNELQKAWDEGIRKLWVLNSGAMKPLEQEITFFLRLAWEIGKPGALTEDVEAFVADWIDGTFSGEIGAQVSALLNDFSQLTNVRKVENMDQDAFSQTAYGDEAAVRIHRYEELFNRGNALYETLPKEEKDAFFQLVLMRIHAAYFTNLAYYYGDRSTLMHERGNMQAAAFYTEKSREAEDARRKLLHYYNHVICGGKWNGILDPEGFPPPRAAMMPVCTPPLGISGEPSMRVDLWNEAEEICFVTPGEKWIEIGNQGIGEFEVRLRAPEWIKLSAERVVIRREERILVSVSGEWEERLGEIVVENCSDGSLRRIPVRMVKPGYDSTGCAPEEDGIIVLEGDAAGERNSESAPLPGKNIQVEATGIGDPQGECRGDESPRGAGKMSSGDFRVIRRLGRMQGNLVEACVQRNADDLDPTGTRSGAEPLSYDFAVHSRGEFLLEIHRFPSLNSVGRLRVGISLDEGPVQVVESVSNDEWRGNWKKNVLNNVDRLYLKLSVPAAGRHRLCVWAIDKYFAFSRMVIYTKPRKENNLAGIRGAQALPAEWDRNAWCERFYGKWELPPRPVFYAAHEYDRDTVAVTCKMAQAISYGGKVTPEWYLERGQRAFEETDGAVRIDAASALAGSGCAWTDEGQGSGAGSGIRQADGSEADLGIRQADGSEADPGIRQADGSEADPGIRQADGSEIRSDRGTEKQSEIKWESGQDGRPGSGQAASLWKHCSSESFGRSGLALYIREPELSWMPENAPSLNYRIRCEGGEYTLWMLSKFNLREESSFSIGMGDEIISPGKLYGNGALWRYEAEQIYRWTPVAQLSLEKGEHILHIYALASGMRYDRFYLTRGAELPPMDTEWAMEEKG
ncbi:MAG: glycosyl hydrolase 115 family protein [Lachnospiraceae bacterium]|nr:glycosyl hydrolase 115 family protein [Butyrivibrio sp.]MCM1344832.1 glycosyl hydrolase 115 family protein [Muribaculaceae bacterium]MCM1409098.1 glycosyl hydrolase 115 family protein [Lachnospiraceae bacterium]